MLFTLLASFSLSVPSPALSRPPWARITKSNTGATVSLELGTMRAVSRIDIPGFAGQPGGFDESLQLDGTSYTFNFNGRMSFTTGEGSPVAGWTEAAMRELEPCWRSVSPRDIG